MPIQARETIHNPQVLRYGEQGSRVFYGLTATPPIFTYIAAGQSNQDLAFRGIVPVNIEQVFLRSRTLGRLAFLPPPPGGVKTLQLGIDGISAVTASLSVLKVFAVDIVGSSSLSGILGPEVPPPPERVNASLRSLRRRRRVWREWDV